MTLFQAKADARERGRAEFVEGRMPSFQCSFQLWQPVVSGGAVGGFSELQRGPS